MGSKIKKYFDMAFDGEPVIVSRKENKNVVIISEAEYIAKIEARETKRKYFEGLL